MKVKRSKVNKTFNFLLLTSLLLSSQYSLFQEKLSVHALDGNQTIYFQPSLNQNQSQTITIPKLTGVTSISVDTGKVNYSINGEKLVINTSDGAYVSREAYIDPQFYSQAATDFTTNSSNNFEENRSFSADGFAGVLNKSGESFVKSGSYTAPVSKTQTDSRSSLNRASVPDTVPYNSGGYVGTLYGQGVTTSSVANGGYYETDTYTQTVYRESGYWKDVTRRELWYYDYSGRMTCKTDPKTFEYKCEPVYTPVYHDVVVSSTWVDTSKWVTETVTDRYWVNSYSTQYSQNYSGTVTYPAVDTRVYQQNYAGTIFKSGTNYRNYQYSYNVTVHYTANNPPSLGFTGVNTQVAGANDVVRVSGTVSDQENDSVFISATLGGIAASTTVPDGNGTWVLEYKASELPEDSYDSITVTANDSSDTVTKTFSFPTLKVDNSLPFFWAITHSPTAPTNGDVKIQVNVGDSDSGIKEVVYPDGTSTKRVNSTYTVSENGNYDFKVVDKAGNSYTETVRISNIDKTLPVASALTLIENKDKRYKVIVKATDASGIDKVILNNGDIMVRDAAKGIYQLDNLSDLPTAVQITDKAGNNSGDIDFLALPSIQLNDYDDATKKSSVTGTISGTDTVSYQIGSKKYTCSDNPCTISISKNADVTVLNATHDKASIRSLSVSNIDKSVVNLILEGIRNPNDSKEIEFSWNLDITNPNLICSTKNEEVKMVPTGNPYIFNGENTSYSCKLTGEYEGKIKESNLFTVYPDYANKVNNPKKSESYDKKTIDKNTYVEKDPLGETYYINFLKNNTDEQIPIPKILIR